MNTGRILRNPAKIAPLRALFRSFAASALWTMCWSVHQYQKPIIAAPKNTLIPGNLSYHISPLGWNRCIFVMPLLLAYFTTSCQPLIIPPPPIFKRARIKIVKAPRISIGACMTEIVIIPFIPPSTVNIPVKRTRPIAPYQKSIPITDWRNIPPVKAVTETFVKT